MKPFVEASSVEVEADSRVVRWRLEIQVGDLAAPAPPKSFNLDVLGSYTPPLVPY